MTVPYADAQTPERRFGDNIFCCTLNLAKNPLTHRNAIAKQISVGQWKRNNDLCPPLAVNEIIRELPLAQWCPDNRGLRRRIRRLLSRIIFGYGRRMSQVRRVRRRVSELGIVAGQLSKLCLCPHVLAIMPERCG
jgi:hypothetical protein